MTDSLNRTATYIITILLLFTAFSASFAQEIKRDTTPVAKDGSYWFLQGMREFNNKNFTAAKEAFQKLVEFEQLLAHFEQLVKLDLYFECYFPQKFVDYS